MSFQKIRVGAALFALLLSACARTTTIPDAAPAPQARESAYTEGVFGAALDAIRKGDPQTIAALREGQSASFQTENFLEQLYKRYGSVRRIFPLSINTEAGISRGVFLAAHEGGPFVWDIVYNGQGYTMLRGSTEFGAYLREISPPPKALATANQAIGDVNDGRANEVFPQITCNCIDAASFTQQVDTLSQQAGAELRRRLVSAETIPGAEENMVLLHFLSERKEAKLGFHLMMWNLGGGWKISSINWTQEELIPRGPQRITSRANPGPTRPWESPT